MKSQFSEIHTFSNETKLATYYFLLYCFFSSPLLFTSNNIPFDQKWLNQWIIVAIERSIYGDSISSKIQPFWVKLLILTNEESSSSSSNDICTLNNLFSELLKQFLPKIMKRSFPYMVNTMNIRKTLTTSVLKVMYVKQLIEIRVK